MKKVRFSFFAFLVICGLLFSSLSLTGCDIFNGDNNNNGNTTDGETDKPAVEDRDIEEGGEYFEPDGDVPPEAPNPNAVVTQLVKTEWAQGEPFNGMLPMNNEGTERLHAGCLITALAQLVNYHRHVHDVAFDWDNMLNYYRKDGRDSNERQRDAVAKLTHHVYNSSGNKANRFISFGYDKTIQSLERKHYDDATWEAIIRTQLDAGLPVYYQSNTDKNDGGGGHAFIVDGYDNTGKFHVNWGWRGYRDGYYTLNPLQHSSDYCYTAPTHVIMINIKPDVGGVGSNEMALNAFTANKTSIVQNELITVTAQIRSAGFFTGGQAGVALSDNTGRIITVAGIINYNELGAGSTRTSTFYNFFLETDPGQYSLRMVTRTEGGEWKIVDLSDLINNIPKAIPITITAESGAPGGGHGVALDSFTVDKESVSQYELFTVRANIRNRMPDIFSGGQMGAALVDNSGDIVEVVGITNIEALNPNQYRTNRTANCAVPDTVAPGQYRLRIVIRPTGGEWRVATMAVDGVPNAIPFTVTAGVANSGGYGLVLTNFTLNNGVVSAPQGGRFAISLRAMKVGAEAFPGGQIGVALVGNDGNIVDVIDTRNWDALESGSSRSQNMSTVTVPRTVTPGQYKLRVVVRPTDGEWKIVTMALDDVSTSIDFEVIQ